MHMCAILPDVLYLGGLKDAADAMALRSQKITHILSLTKDSEDLTFDGSICHKCISMDDSPDEEIELYFEACFQVIQNAINSKGRVLVHCNMGIRYAH